MSDRLIWRSAAACGLLCLLAPSLALGQLELSGGQQLAFDRPEAWAMKYFASATLPSALGAPRALAVGEIDLSLEYGQIPSLSEEERTVGFGGVKEEDLNKVPYYVRPRVDVGLGRKLTLSVGYLPPVERNGARPNVLTVALGRPVYETPSWRFSLRLHGQVGSVEGDFTCSARTVAAGDDPEKNSFGCSAVSRDDFETQTLGLEASMAWELGAQDRWEPYISASIQRMDLEFQVRAEYSNIIDRSRLLTEGHTWSATAGVGCALSSRWRLVGEIFYSPLEVVRPPSVSRQTDELLNARALLTYKVR